MEYLIYEGKFTMKTNNKLKLHCPSFGIAPFKGPEKSLGNESHIFVKFEKVRYF